VSSNKAFGPQFGETVYISEVNDDNVHKLFSEGVAEEDSTLNSNVSVRQKCKHTLAVQFS